MVRGLMVYRGSGGIGCKGVYWGLGGLGGLLKACNLRRGVDRGLGFWGLGGLGLGIRA